MKHHIIVITTFLVCIFFFTESYGQGIGIAFDPKCYVPTIGNASEIDTIYGGSKYFYLGSGMLNIGTKPGESYGRITCNLFSYSGMGYSIFKTGPTFNLHAIDTIGTFNIEPSYIIRRGHFRSPKYSDILWGCTDGCLQPARIFWQDDEGNYDSSRYTILATPLPGKSYTDYSPMIPYSSHILSDSVEDIIYMAVIADNDSMRGLPYLLYFQGGEVLKNKGRFATADSIFALNNLIPNPFSTSQGDYRGVGRNDLIMSDYIGNWFYFKNDPPFSMASVLQAFRYDTLLAKWENPKGGWYLPKEQLAMHALPKPPGDSSYDFLPLTHSKYDTRSIQEIRIFKGGHDFGAHRWTADSAAFVIHEPYYFDSRFEGLRYGTGIRDCGDMTGTGNRVLYVSSDFDGGFYGYHFFYVLGEALDEKIDMFIALDNSGICGNQMDTLVADGDKLQDVIMALSAYGLAGGNDANGTIYVVHGSTKIPVRKNSVRHSIDEPSSVSINANPVTNRICNIDLSHTDQQLLQFDIFDMLGRKVYSEGFETTFAQQTHPVNMSSFPNGTYMLEVKGKTVHQRIKFSVLK